MLFAKVAIKRCSLWAHFYRLPENLQLDVSYKTHQSAQITTALKQYHMKLLQNISWKHGCRPNISSVLSNLFSLVADLLFINMNVPGRLRMWGGLFLRDHYRELPQTCEYRRKKSPLGWVEGLESLDRKEWGKKVAGGINLRKKLEKRIPVGTLGWPPKHSHQQMEEGYHCPWREKKERFACEILLWI